MHRDPGTPCRSIRMPAGRGRLAALDLLHQVPNQHGPVIPPTMEISKETLSWNPTFVAPDLSFFANLEPNQPKVFTQNNKVFELVSKDPHQEKTETFENGVPTEREVIFVYTDGGYVERQTFNGLTVHIATIGVYFPNDERMHRAEAVHATSPARAEMLAVVRALEVIGDGPNAVVYVDCQKVIDHLRLDQASGWTRNRPLHSIPEEDLTPEQLLSRIVRKRSGKTTVSWVRSHDGNISSGNSNADALCSFTRNRLVETHVQAGLYLERGFAQENGMTGAERVTQFCEAMYTLPK
ncbi:hypothetical protein HDU86_006833 [Geranomyces michiganensis]|nr:hypothetical protein HDU86_006833 [Geranomyces michiganensis]